MRIVIQAGHINCANNTIVAMRKNTGAPGEQEVNKRIADRLSAMLRDRKFTVIQTDACANSDPAVTKQDHDLFIALHCDADYPGDNGSGFADFPQPSTDQATKESQKIVGILNDVYFKETKINYVNHSNENTRYYYMWKYLTAKTPCALIEMGQCQDPHDKVLLGNTDLIASALARAICKAFNVAYDLPPVVEPPKPVIVTTDDSKIDLGAPYGVKTLKEIKELLANKDGFIATLTTQKTDLGIKLSNAREVAGQLSIILS